MLEGRAGIYTVIRDARAVAAFEELASLARARGLVDVLARALIGMTYDTGWRDNARSRALLQEALQTISLENVKDKSDNSISFAGGVLEMRCAYGQRLDGVIQEVEIKKCVEAGL